jgi:outer membrane protein OmpA-like peptidoglycan-associated protein
MATSRVVLTALAIAALSVAMAVAQAPPKETAAPRSTEPIPLVAGLTIVNAVSDPGAGDYEGIKRVSAVTTASVTFTASAQTPDGETLVVKRMVRRDDLRSAHTYRPRFHTDDPVEFPGTTSFSVSTAVLSELVTAGRTAFTLEADDVAAGLGGLLGNLLGGQAGGLRETLADAQRKRGTLERMGTRAVPVLVNDQRINLSAIHAAGTLGGERADFYLLDQPDNPLVLAWEHEGARSQVVKIMFPVAAAERRIERTLRDAGLADIYGIYFDFAKATIRPESDAVLQEIAQAMTGNPSWRLTINGHTDNIGRDASNLELSKRRAAAVRQALVERHGIAADRLTTGGFGASRPAESNDTLAGRARNRRVELVRQ